MNNSYQDKSTSGSAKSQEAIQTIANFAEFKSIMDAMPLSAALLNHELELLYCNAFMESMLNKPHESYYKNKIGDAFGCINASGSPASCIDTRNCEFCSIYKLLKEALSKKVKITDDCHLTIGDKRGRLKSYLNLRITASPFQIKNEEYLLFTMIDISNDIRKRMLERIFFHDVLNKAGNITGILDLLHNGTHSLLKQQELVNSLKTTSSDLIEEILYQRDLTAAENNELKAKKGSLNSIQVLNQVNLQIANSDVAFRKKVIIDPASVALNFESDGILLRRVLLNMLKNALEAEGKSGEVTLGCNQPSAETIQFWVHNETLIPEEIQQQLFNKLITTKAAGRGLGTYSIKLLGEKYLNGKVTFVSTPETGTVFKIDLPVIFKKKRD